MKPGRIWRVLAHRDDGTSVDLRSAAMKARDEAFRADLPDRAVVAVVTRFDTAEYLDAPSTFDEVVVDRWLHVEQMSERWYWMQVGETHINVKVGRKGRAVKMTVEGGGVPFTECDLKDEL